MTKPEIFALPGTGSIRFALTILGSTLTSVFPYVRSYLEMRRKKLDINEKKFT